MKKKNAVFFTLAVIFTLLTAQCSFEPGQASI